ncbi:MAG: MBOAT family protein [Pseudomonadota bacterium]|nr:MBOAT family protein [Pseudomonadota bacterium]
MLFNSWTFLAFFAITFCVHRATPTWRGKKWVLLGASYVFYAAWNPPYALILLLSTFVDWIVARMIWQSEGARIRRWLLLLSLVANLSLLGFFKYGDFLLRNTQALLLTLGIDYAPPDWSIVLPVGISFYTFASLSYTIDVYRRQIRGDASFGDYALFVSFFPHLVAGPIVRASALLPQFAQARTATAAQFGWGVALTISGLFCKVVLADYVFAPAVDAVYAHPSLSVFDAWLGVFCFSGQIYYDFSGYSLCAIGLALCFGFSFPDNFRQPYAARGFSDFWRRWHISLSTWLRDYLYIPLGGSRRGPQNAYRNLFLTMLLGGLWHGASWMFVLWGALHGTYLVVERALYKGSTAAGQNRQLLLTALTFVVVTLTWIPFRAPDFATASGIVGAMLLMVEPGSSAVFTEMTLLMCTGTLVATLIWQFHLRDSSLEVVAARTPEGTRVVVLGLLLTAMYLCSGGDQRAFIYFQF